MSAPTKTLRDEYAMAALIAMGLPPPDMMQGNMARTARTAFAWADVLMQERDTPKEQLTEVGRRHKF